jgi:acetyl-CoA carboxylase biotin carboxyl carrier protein
MNITFLKQLVKIVESSEIEELEIRKWWTKVRITKSRLKKGSCSDDPGRVVEVQVPEQAVEKKVESPPAPPDEDLIPIKSPMVGTFYLSPSPGAKAYVQTGDQVSPGQVVCIIEAMKLMNEIESDVSGKLARIMVEDGQPVEFGQTLFLVSPA